MDWHIAAIVCAFVVMDIVTGIIQAVANKTLDSSKMRAGFWHKCGFIMIVILAALVEWSMQFIDLGFTLPLFVPVCVFIILTEIVSIFENVCQLSPELANSRLAQLFNIDVK